MSFSVPDPPDPSDLRPLLFTWEAGHPFVRCHNARFGATEFNPGQGRGGRFHPFADTQGRIIPTLYAASDLEGALSETVFHSVPVRGPGKRIGRFKLERLVASTVDCDRDLTLARLFGHGLRRLGVTRLELIETDAEDYPRTAAWARALHVCDQRIDGLIWVSRQNDGTRSLVLFGDRVSASSLRALERPVPLSEGAGYEEVQRAADLAGITIFE